MNDIKPTFLRRVWMKVQWPLFTFASLYCLYVAMMYYCQRSFIFPGQAFAEPVNPTRSATPFGAEAIWIETAGVKCEVWYFPPDEKIATNVIMPTRAPVVFYTHGNGEYIDNWSGTLQQYRQWGCGLVLVEYPGYGRSIGAPSETAIADVLCQAYDNIIKRPEIDPEKVILHGRSLGGGAICALASRRPAAALILESTFTSVASMAGGLGLPGFLVRDKFDNLSVVSDWKKPILIMHGKLDNVVPFSQGKALAAVAPHAKFIEWNASHNESPPSITLAWGDVRKFLNDAKLLPELKPLPPPKPKPKPKAAAKPAQKPPAKPAPKGAAKKPAAKPVEKAKPKPMADAKKEETSTPKPMPDQKPMEKSSEKPATNPVEEPKTEKKEN